MEKVKVQKGWLLDTLKENREKHHGQYVKAFQGYRLEAIEWLEESLSLYKEGGSKRLIFTEKPPEDQTKDYDRAIAMLEASVDPRIELSESDFQSYVQDDWNWKEAWLYSNTKYLGNEPV